MRRDWMTSVAAVDLGTARIRVWHPQRGPVLDEPSLIALDEQQGHACALGASAKRMIGRLPHGLTIRRAVAAGRVTDFEAALLLARYALDHVRPSRPGRRQTVVTAAPVDSSSVQVRTLEQALLRVGAHRVVVVPAPVAAALGGALPFADGSGGMLVDLGAGTVDVAVFARGRMVDATSLPGGGDALDEAVAGWVRREHQVALGPVAAEALRIGGGAGDPATAATPLQARGRHLGTDANQVVYVRAEEVRQACRAVLTDMAAAIRVTLARCPEELRAEIAERGVVLTGGLAQSPWARERLQELVDAPLRAADAPQDRTAEGLAVLARSPERADEYAVRA
ncbi:rod shape-determining protein [Streptacidiphilus neutrinimicus]|uniref:rod shape-determining protein n=1 Tax=Streptacidiphilus neutrinimicus TaxID=105420 RepID=UPI000A605F21|nr:rod shape-determining protein [Streptacidiphilus neutrinimicus]